MTDKEIQITNYKKMVSKYSDKKLLKEIKSYRKYFQVNNQRYHWCSFNPDDFTQADIFLILREELNTRGLKENDR